MSDSPHETLRADDDIGPLVEAHGELTLDPADDLFERLVVSILRQQVSMASAAATRERLFDAVSVTPEGILAADDAILRDAGLSRQKTRYVNEVADAFRREGYSMEYFAGMSDDAVRSELTGITGVGRWTADMQLMFALGREDVFPVGDLGIRKGFRAVVGDVEDRAAMTTYAEAWAPFRSYASLYLWRASEDIAESVDEVVES
ncbi:DNA-3-methyladenine glycosylase family protein [Halomicroarcula sp. GCM10025817]|uniref:DNA-3-methyladenine glycosylase family protein n=1 Tax=Haloarcula TaxID=2237 RepID=UPI0023E8FC1E|nr:DNA-3-methyladenine glycosylase 2 family protein [Halomicroarcula sp. SYNS111]